VLLGFCLASSIIVVLGLYHRARGTLLRAAVFLALIIVFLNPSAQHEKREALRDTALVAIDDSASMRLGDRAVRTAHATDAVMAKLRNIPNIDIVTLHVSGTDETDLFTAISNKLPSLPHNRLAAIIAITDGQIHDKLVRPFSVPFHVLMAGHKDDLDRRLVLKSVPAYGIVGKTVRATLRVEDQPKPQSSDAVIILHHDDGTTQTITAPIGKDIDLDVPVTHPGPNLFAATTEVVPNELTPVNNTVTATVSGIRDHLRVLLISGTPHSGGRAWRNLLKADAAIDLVHFTILRTPEKETFADSKDMALIVFPARELFETKLKNFDLVVFDRFSKRSLIPDEYLANIANYVQQGGGLLISNATDADQRENGFDASPLASILPAEPTGDILTGSFIPALTESGQRHPVLSSLTSMQPRDTWSPWYRQVNATARRGNIVMSGLHGVPLLVLDHVGTGRVAQFLSDQFWLWGRGYQQGGPQTELLRRVAHWLVQEPELDETALKAKAIMQDGAWSLAITLRSLGNNPIKTIVTDPDNQSQSVMVNPSHEPGLLSTTVPVSKTGLYHVQQDERDVMVMVGPSSSAEFGDVIATDEKLLAIAKASGGSVTWLADNPDGPTIKHTDADASQSGWGWIGLRRNGQYRVTGSETYPSYPVWAILAVLLAVMLWGWKREGSAKIK
jgi:hypothetical protein